MQRAEMRQLTLATAGFDKHRKLTRRSAFLAEMEQVVPWRELCVVVEPFYPKAGNGRPPSYGLVAHHDAARRKDQFDLSEAQAEAGYSHTVCWMISAGKRKPR